MKIALLLYQAAYTASIQGYELFRQAIRPLLKANVNRRMRGISQFETQHTHTQHAMPPTSR